MPDVSPESANRTGRIRTDQTQRAQRNGLLYPSYRELRPGHPVPERNSRNMPGPTRTNAGTDAADIQGPAAGGKELQGDCRTIWHSAEKGRQTTSTGSYQVASRIERLFLDYLYLIERIRLRSEIRVTINSSVLGSENEIILE